MDTEKLLKKLGVGTGSGAAEPGINPTANNGPESIPHEDESTWFVCCTRNEAERKLKDQDEGTFLVRPSRQEGSYALSIV